MYHHYTVDEHLLAHRRRAQPDRGGDGSRRTIRWSAKCCPISPIAPRSTSPPSCTTSPRDVPRIIRIAGAEVARRLCPRLGLSPADCDRVAWLVEQHLTMSNMAQGRDLADPRTAESLAAIVQTLGAAEDAAGADGLRHPRGRTGRVERLEGPVAAHAVLGDRSRARRRALGDRPQVARRGGPGGAAARASRLVRPRIRRLRAAPLPRLLAESGAAAPGRARQTALRDGGRRALAGDGSRDRRATAA